MKKILLAAVSFVFVASSVMAQKHDWANFARFAEENAQISTRPDVVFMGNSITELWIKTHPVFFSSNNYVSRGISGQVSSQMLCRFRPDVINLNPKAVVILSGTNDIAENNGYITNENIYYNIVSMCELAKANGIIPIICSIIPCDKYLWREEVEPVERIKDLNIRLAAYAKKNGYEYVDYYTSLDDGNGALKPGYSNDHCHPTAAGYDVMEPIVKKAINKVLKKAKKK